LRWTKRELDSAETKRERESRGTSRAREHKPESERVREARKGFWASQFQLFTRWLKKLIFLSPQQCQMDVMPRTSVKVTLFYLEMMRLYQKNFVSIDMFLRIL